ncbi:unnamed protein product, partial [Aureobasidium uvarum]
AMAILNGLPGIEITVVVDGKDLHEYQDSDMDDEADTVTRYVEAVDGANFAIKIKATGDNRFKGDYLSFMVEVDGSWIDEPLISAAHVREGRSTRIVDGVYVRSGYSRTLKFSTLTTVLEHDSRLLPDLERVKNLGKIKVTVTHQTRIGQSTKPYGQPSDNGNVVSEKSIKGQAMSHTYSLDPEVSASLMDFWETKPVPGVKNPVGSYVFHYRSEWCVNLAQPSHNCSPPPAALKELLIIPRTPSPVPLEDRPEKDLSPEEMAELLRRYRAKDANSASVKKQVKRESEDAEDNDSHSHKRARLSNGPVHLELNDDDTFTEVAVPVKKEKEKETIALD